TAVVSVSGNGETYSDMVVQVPDQQLLDAVRNAGDLSVGQVALPEWMPQSLGLRGGDTVTVTGPSGSVDLVISHRPMTDDGSLVVLLPDMVGVDPLDGERALWA